MWLKTIHQNQMDGFQVFFHEKIETYQQNITRN